MILLSSEVQQQEMKETSSYNSNKKTKLILSILIPIISVLIVSIIGYLFISRRNNNEETNFQWNQRTELSSIINDIIKQYKVIGWEIYPKNLTDDIEEQEIVVIKPIREKKSNGIYKAENNPEYIKKKDIIDEKVKSAIKEKPLEEVEEYESYIEELVLRINHNLAIMKMQGCNINEMISAIKEFYDFIRDVWLELKTDSSIFKKLTNNTEEVKCFNYIGKNITIPFLFTKKDTNITQEIINQTLNFAIHDEYSDKIGFEMLLLVENYFQAFLLESSTGYIFIHKEIKKLKIIKLIIEARKKEKITYSYN